MNGFTHCFIKYTALAITLSAMVILSGTNSAQAQLLPMLNTYLEQRASEFDQIPPERREKLDAVAREIQTRIAARRPVNLIFICTHNSRRSHFGQVWGAAAAAYFGLPRISTYSGGTEETACNPRTINAFRRAGFSIDVPKPASNPVYTVHYSSSFPPAACFSKIYNSPVNPQKNFIAVMTCSDADEKCPIVIGATARFPITYEDPKRSDGTPEEAATYDETCRLIAREWCYVMSRAKNGS